MRPATPQLPSRPSSFRPTRRELLASAALLPLAAPAIGENRAVRPLRRRAIPASGETIPIVGLGTWRVFDVGAGERSALEPLVARFVALGGAVIDSSPMYGRAEATIGAIQQQLGARDRLFLATKVWIAGRREGIEQMERSLGLLRAGTIDLMQVHNLLDTATHLETLTAWKREGRVRYVGVTHYQAAAHDELAAWIRRGGIDFVQVNFSIVEREAAAKLLPLAASAGVAVLANRPFAAGEAFARLRARALPGWLAERGCTSWAQAMLKWVLSNPAVTCALPATSKLEHLEENLDAGAGWLPAEDERERLTHELDGALGR